MQSSSSPPSAKRLSSKNRVLLGNIALFALASGVAGMFIGALVGIANYFNSPSYTLMSNGTVRPNEWWEVVRFCTLANGVFMSLVGVLVGVIVFVCVNGASSRWSQEHKERFFHRTKTRLFLPLGLSIFLASLLVMGIWWLWHGSMTSPSSDLGSAIEWAGVAMLPISAALWTFLWAHASRSAPSEKPIFSGRLLPLD